MASPPFTNGGPGASDGGDDDFEDIVDDGCAPDPGDLGMGVQAGEGSEDEFEINGYGGGGDGDDGDLFDAAVGVLEELLVDDAFSGAQEAFAREHCHEFEDSDENKLSYTALFDAYTGLVEGFIEARLEESLPGFDMAAFMGQIEERHEEVSGDVLDVLASLADFASFKALMLDYRRSFEISAGNGSAAGGGGGGAGFGDHRRGVVDLCVSVCPVFSDEQVDGTPMPDLNLTISPVPSPVASSGNRAKTAAAAAAAAAAESGAGTGDGDGDDPMMM